eukprot:8570681-Alexandrium_andersonii.AAC.1
MLAGLAPALATPTSSGGSMRKVAPLRRQAFAPSIALRMSASAAWAFSARHPLSQGKPHGRAADRYGAWPL